MQTEALRRGYEVTAVVSDPSKLDRSDPKLTVVEGDITDADSVARSVAGHDAVVSSYGPPPDDPKAIVSATRSLFEGLTRAGVTRLVAVGGAGSLEVAPGVQLVDAPEFPSAWIPIALAHRDALDVFVNEGGNLQWTNFSPAAFIEPGERTGTFRLGGDALVVDASGQSRISAEDYAIALLDEVEKPRYVKKRFTIGY